MVTATFPYNLKYNPNRNLSLSEIAETLISNEKITQYIGEILEGVYPGVQISSLKISLHKLEYGSLREEFVVSIVLAYQKDIQESVVSFIEGIIHYDIPKDYEWVVALLVLLIVLRVAQGVYSKIYPKKEPPAAIAGNYNTIVNITAKTIHVSPELLDNATQRAAAKGGRSLARAVARFLQPAKGNGGTPIDIDGTPGVDVAAVREFPSQADLEWLDTQHTEDYPDTLLEIRVIDRDKNESGWVARMPEIKATKNRRLPMRLYPTIRRDQVAPHERVRANVILEYRANQKGELVPNRIHAVEILGPA